jgi:hypothetical protein
MVEAHRRAFVPHSPLLTALAHIVFSILFKTAPDIAKSHELVGSKNSTN